MTPLINQALDLHRSGDRTGAERLYRQVLETDPGEIDALHLLGLCLHEQNLNDEAIDYLSKAVAFSPDSAVFRNSLGVVRMAMNELAVAEASFRKALRIAPNSQEANRNLNRAIKRRVEQANQLADQGDLSKAIAICESILVHQPAHPIALKQLAILLEQCLDQDRLVEIAVRALKVDSNCVTAHLILGRVLASRLTAEKRSRMNLQEQQELTEKALMHLRHAILVTPSAETFGLSGRMLLDAGRHDEAIEHMNQSIKLQGNFAPAHESLGLALLEKGEVDKAADKFREAISFDPLSVESHYELARIGKDDNPREAAELLERLIGSDQLNDQGRVRLRYAQARRLEQAGDYDAAFEAYRTANREKIEHAPPARTSPERRQRQLQENFLADRLIATFDAEHFKKYADFYGSDSERPVFIVGMPRSGTTLTEQIITSHPDVHGAGELIAISDLGNSLQRRLDSDKAWPENVGLIPHDMLKQLADEYLQLLSSYDSSTRFITDKMPTNFRSLGLIARLFPNARVIHVRRNPLDVAVSSFRENLDWPFCDLQAFGHYYKQYVRLMEHWHEVTPLRILDVQYEALIDDQHGETARMIEFLDLLWDDSCLMFERSKRAVKTPSKLQVRKPIYRTSIDRWRRYERQLKPLIELLEE